MDHRINSKINVLMTGAGAPGAPGIIKCLLEDARINLLIVDANKNAAGRYIHPNFTEIPFHNDPNFINSIKEICVNHNIHIILPLVTKELFLFSENKKEFDAINCKVLVSDYRALSIANNKARLYQELHKEGVIVPEFYIANTLEEFDLAIESLDYPDKDICIKPAISNGSRGFRILSEHINEYQLLFNEKPNNTFSTAAKIRAILMNNSFPKLVISEYLPGPEYSVDCIANNGETVVAVPRIRTKMKEGISVEGSFINNKEIIDYCKAIIKTLKLSHNIGIQVKQAADGTFKILEINPRVQGTIVAGLGAGINLPLLAIKEAMGIPFTPEELEVKWGTHFIRYFTEAYYI